MLPYVTGLLLVAVPIAFNAAFFQLQRSFDYPDILRRPVDEILRRFRDGGPALRLRWYVLAASAIAFIPIPVLVEAVFGTAAPWYLPVATLFGSFAGLVQVLGLLRWPFVVGTLAETYAAPGASEARREAAAVAFEALHRYAGVAIGEHLGYLFTAIWTLLVSVALLTTATGLVHTLLGGFGLVCAAMVFVGVFEEAGSSRAGMINAIGYVLWSLWLAAFGVATLLGVP